MHYVIDRRKGWVAHEGNEESCIDYVNFANYRFGGDFHIVNGAKDRDAFIKDMKASR